jgi:hypothetical protein
MIETSDFQIFSTAGSLLFRAPIPRRVENLAQKKRAAVLWAIQEGLDLRDADLLGADLSGLEFHGSSMRGASLLRSDLSGANLYRCDLSATCLVGAFLCDANLGRANLRSSDLTNADATGADLHRADLAGARWLMAKSWPNRLSGLLDDSLIEDSAALDLARDDLTAAASTSSQVIGALSEALAADHFDDRQRHVARFLTEVNEASVRLGYPMAGLKRFVAASPLTGSKDPGEPDDYERLLKSMMLAASAATAPILGDSKPSASPVGVYVNPLIAQGAAWRSASPAVSAWGS